MPSPKYYVEVVFQSGQKYTVPARDITECLDNYNHFIDDPFSTEVRILYDMTEIYSSKE